MNFLAHFYLTDGSTDALVGALLGDFMKGLRMNDLTPGVRRGVELHLRVDAYTDAHDVVAGSRARIGPTHRRYAGVLVDMFYDHFLALHWARYSPLSLGDFAAGVYARLHASRERMPERMRRSVDGMIEGDWLSSYASLEGIEGALAGIARRVPRENTLAEAGTELRAHYLRFEEDFQLFFPDLRRHAAQFTPSR